MVKHSTTCLYKEARLNIEPAFPGSTIAFTLPSSSTSTFGTKTNGKRTVITEQYVDQDETAFARRHLATDGSLFFRTHHEYPRTFLWRILDNRRMLEIQAVDLDHDANHKFEANLTLLLQFPAPLRPFCIAFAEPVDRDALVMFAVTTANDLYAITLHRDFFCNLAASETDVENWCKRTEPLLFSGRIPYRLTALSVDELLVALDDGAIARLQWHKENKTWDGARYQNSNWSVRGLLSWKSQPTVRFEDVDLCLSAAAAVAVSPDKKHILTVTLDHTLRTWNIATGKQGVQVDLLGINTQALEKPNANVYSINPSQCKLMAVVDRLGGIQGAAYHVVTYSPKDHQFKFWGIRDADDTTSGIYDLTENINHVPPIDELMDTSVWTMEEWYVVPGPSAGWRGSELWIRARSGPSSRVYTLNFDLGEIDERTQAWKYNWVSVHSGPLTVDGLKYNLQNPSERSVELGDGNELSQDWLDFLLFPGRFTIPTLETALSILKKGLDQTRPSKALSRGSLKERLYHTIVAVAVKFHSELSDAQDFEATLRLQWAAYYGLVKDLHKRRGESLSLAFDCSSTAPWLVLSDHLSAIRGCSEVEVVLSNAKACSSSNILPRPLRKASETPGFRDTARLLNAASLFRKRLPVLVQVKIERQIEMDLLQSRSLTIVDRMEWIETHSEISQHVSDEDVSLLVEELGIEVRDLDSDAFLRALEMLGYPHDGRLDGRRQLARFGLNALLRVTQETLEQDHKTLLDLIVLILFVFVELEGELPDQLDAPEIFVDLITRYKECITLSWLAKTVWATPAGTGPASEVINRSLSESLKVGKKLPFTQTILEGIYAQNAFVSVPKRLKANLLTTWSRGWIASVYGGGYEAETEETFSILLLQKEYGLAADFAKFMVDGPWATYLRARLHLAAGDVELAAIAFRKIAYSLASKHFDIENVDSKGVVSETERNSFSAGQPNYYSHVLGLFEKVQAYSYVAEFAKLGLRSIHGHTEKELRTELLSRLFTASIQTSRFEDAFSAMTRHHDTALKRSALQTLVITMVAQSQTPQLFAFPLLNLTDDIDSVLLSLCQRTLNLASGPPYHQILYSFRISRNNFRGAAAILYDRLQRLKSTSSKIHDPSDESLTQCYLTIINTLSCVSEQDAYILAEQKLEGVAPAQWGIGQGKKVLKRQIVTLDSLRKEFQAELDRVAAVENGQYAFVGGVDDMDIL